VQTPEGAARPLGAETGAEAYVAGGDLAAAVATLKAGVGKPVIAHGGSSRRA
jgi:hypothetical protein